MTNKLMKQIPCTHSTHNPNSKSIITHNNNQFKYENSILYTILFAELIGIVWFIGRSFGVDSLYRELHVLLYQS